MIASGKEVDAMKLSEELSELGFFPVRGTLEKVGGENRVAREGKPRTYGVKNGILAVYDENGLPWIIEDGAVSAINNFKSMLRRHLLTEGAHVPHAEDGGEFLRTIFPKIPF
jgi:hypothetical protein